MTNGEKFKEIFKLSQVDECDLNVYVWLPIHDAIEIPLEWWNAEYEEPTTKNDLGVDCISREAVERIINKWLSHPDYELKDHIYSMTEKIHNLSPATPQEPKTGHWIANAPQYSMLNPQYICSECGNAHTRTTPYCEMCGAKMVEPQESEDT